MSTFDTTKASLKDLLREITEGKIQLPDFQRGWIWDDDFTGEHRSVLPDRCGDAP